MTSRPGGRGRDRTGPGRSGAKRAGPDSAGPGSAGPDSAGPGSAGPGSAGPSAGGAEIAGEGTPDTVPRSHVEPGTGWPGDPATARTPVARSPADVRELAATAAGLGELSARESVCRACPRLVAWREQVAMTRRRSFAAERYWGRPIPGWGPAQAGIAIVGLAPAAHGGNRTGRIFTGDRSGDVLFASLYRCGLAAQPDSITADDGQRLIGTRMLAAVRCAPPQNKPTPQERDTCAPWLEAELALLPALRVVVCLGAFAWQAVWPPLAAAGFAVPRPRPAFGHGAEVVLERDSVAGDPGDADGPGAVRLVGCYHPSQQNTFTGRVTPDMLDDVFSRARELADG